MTKTINNKILLFLLSFFVVSTSLTQINTPEKRLTRIDFLHGKIFELENDSSYVKNPTFYKIKEGRDSLAPNYPSNKLLKQFSFSSATYDWAAENENEADAYITFLEKYIRKRRL